MPGVHPTGLRATARRSRPTVVPCDRSDRPLQWVWYALGGGLPRDLSPWVLADTTGRTWIVRHLVRAVVQMVPVVALCLFAVPVPLAYRVSAPPAACSSG